METINPFTPSKAPRLIEVFDRMSYFASAVSWSIRIGNYDAAVTYIAALSDVGKEAIRITKEEE